MPPLFDLPVLQFPVLGYRYQFAYGGTAVLALSDDGKRVLKFPLTFETQHCNAQVAARARSHMEESRMMLEREKEIYQHLGLRAGILAPLEISSVGLVFPFFKNGDLRRRPSSGYPLRNPWVYTNAILARGIFLWGTTYP
ncbi:hypothetical protein DPSP01_012667 [Paraphaeosphaeria sporulosa]